MGFVHDCGGDGVPEPTGCEDPLGTGSFELTLGTEALDLSFIPLSEGDALTVLRGSQGSLMVPVRVGLSGADGASCASVRLEVRGSDGTSLDTFEGNLAVATEGSLVATEAVYFISGEWPVEVLIVADVGDASVTGRVRVPSEPTPDGG